MDHYTATNYYIAAGGRARGGGAERELRQGDPPPLAAQTGQEQEGAVSRSSIITPSIVLLSILFTTPIIRSIYRQLFGSQQRS